MIASGLDFTFAPLAYPTYCAGCANAAPLGEIVNVCPQLLHGNDRPAICAACSGVTV
jgi:hypothetical protein